MENGTPPILYHYCSVETFYNIIINKTLWLTDSFSTNDYMENRWINKIIGELLPNYKNDENRQLFDNVFNLYELNDYTPFITCFSKNGDLLSQWRAYANDGSGIAIGFNTAYFNIEHQLPFTMAVFNKHSIGLHEVYYDYKIQLDIINRLLYEISLSRHIPDEKTIELASKLKRYSFILKNPAFFEEQEWRIIYTPLILGCNQDDTTQVIGAISDCKFRVTSNDIAPYFLLSFSEQKDISPISEIILGPKNKMSPQKLWTFLSINNLKNVSIKLSNASYR